MIENKFVIKMPYIEAVTFMYGTTIIFDKVVHFENQLMPSGTVIHSWIMTSAYFRERHIPTLPILKRNYQYKISFGIKEEPTNSVYFKLLMYRRNKSLIEAIVFHDKIGTFTYDEEAYYYEIEMLSASVQTFDFEAITIEEITKKDNEHFSYNQERNIVIVEPSLLYRERPYAAVAHLDDVILVTVDELNEIDELKAGLNFIGYGPLSNKIAEKFAEEYDGYAWVTHRNTVGRVYSKLDNDFKSEYFNNAHYLKQLQPIDLKR